MTDKETLKQVLEALEELFDTNGYWWQEVDEQTLKKIEHSITAIKEYMAQPEQEPTNIERHERNVQKFLGASQPKEPEQDYPENFIHALAFHTAISDLEPEQEPCGGCGGSGWVPRDPDIGTDQECFVCGGSGAKPEQEPDDLTIAYMAGFSRGKDLAPQRKPLSDAQAERLYLNIEPSSRQQYARSLAAFKRLLRYIEETHNIKE